MKVVALSRTTTLGPSTRYRIEQYRASLQAAGIELELRPLFGAGWFRILERPPGPGRTLLKALYSLGRLAARLNQVWSLRRASPDLVLVEQQLFPYLPTWMERLLWPKLAPTVLEFDDAIYLTSGHRTKLQALCAQADLVIVGNRFLADFARPHAQQLAVIPTTVDLSRYSGARDIQRERRRTAGKTLRVAWIGLRYNFPFLEMLAAPMARLAQEGWDLELRIISSAAPVGGPAWGAVRLVHRPWSEETEADELGACDVGVMPLPDSEWARGKCGLKVLQCLAAGVPVVCSPVGVNGDIVSPGQNGFLAADEDGWYEALRALAENPELRQRLGEAGLNTVRLTYDLPKGAEKLMEAYGLAASSAEEDSGPMSETAADPRR